MVIKGVYCLTFPNGKRYVGIGMSKTGINERFNAYKKLRCKDQSKLYNALKKYGPENVNYQVVLETSDNNRVKSIEKQLIALWNLQSDKYGYNMTAGGDGIIGFKHTEKTKKFLSIIQKGKHNSVNTEFKKGMVGTRKGKYVSLETKMKMSVAKKGKISGNKGKKMSVDSRNKMSAAKKGSTPWNKGKVTGIKSPLGIERKIKNIVTGEVIIGFLNTLAKLHDFQVANILKRKKSKNYILIEGN